MPLELQESLRGHPTPATCVTKMINYPSVGSSDGTLVESAMSIRPPAENLLNVLRANLRRIEAENRDKDLTPAAFELKQLLLCRIANRFSAASELTCADKG
jgi:hypothetical protein